MRFERCDWGNAIFEMKSSVSLYKFKVRYDSQYENALFEFKFQFLTINDMALFSLRRNYGNSFRCHVLWGLNYAIYNLLKYGTTKPVFLKSIGD